MEARYGRYSLVSVGGEFPSRVLPRKEEHKQNRENFYRLQNALFDLGSEVLRDVMLQLLRPDTLKQALQLNKSKIDELYYKDIVFSLSEYNLLKEVPPHPEKFDVDLLTKLLIHICPGVSVSPGGLFKIPDQIDFTIRADIERLDNMRDDLFNSDRVTDYNFEKTWCLMEEALFRISKHGSKVHRNLQEKIEFMKIGPLRTRPALPRMVEEILILTVLFDLGSEVLRDVMLQLLQPNTLTQTLQSSKSKIDELYKRNKISPHDYDLLKQLPPQPEKFNIHLLINILTQFCPGVKVPLAGWLQSPVPTDCILGADIQHLEWLIDSFLGKCYNQMTDEDVEKTWNEVETVLVGISKHGSKKITNIHERIEAKKTSKLKAVQARKGFIDLLKETPDIDMYSHWDDVIPKIESEHRYLAVDNDLLREIFFIENKLDMVKEDFTQLLNSVPDIDKHTTWNDVKQRVKEDPLYMMISDVIADQDAKCFEKLFTMEQWFFDYKRDLDINRAILKEMNEVKKEVDTIYLGYESWPAYLATDNDGGKLQTKRKHVFVVELPADIISHIKQNKPKPVRDIELVFRCPNDRSIEFANCIYETSDSKMNDKDTEKKIIATIRNNCNVLHAQYSKLSEIRLSKVKSSGFGTENAYMEEKYCIALVVPNKGLIPISERPFPPTINGFPTDVWEGEVFPLYHAPSHQILHPLRMGSSFSIKDTADDERIVTVGPLISHNARTYILSVAHGTFDTTLKKNQNLKLDPSTNVTGISCFQPNSNVEKVPFGIVVKRCFDRSYRQDAALIEITKPSMGPTTGEFPDTRDPFGMSNGCPMRFSSGRIIDRTDAPPSTSRNSDTEFVIKYGATSGLTKGYISQQDPTYPNRFEVMNDMKYTYFSRQGDSGSLVLLVKKDVNCPVHTNGNTQDQCSCDVGALGIITQGNTAGTTYCLYIKECLRSLGLDYINTCIPFNQQNNSVPLLRTTVP